MKRRLNAPFQKEEGQLAKLQKALKPVEFAAAMVAILLPSLQTSFIPASLTP